jgi:cytoskeleton protein RodZ
VNGLFINVVVLMSNQLVLDGVEPPPVAPDFGALRVARGWSEQDVAERLKISVAKVRAIEKLDFGALPDGPYTRGFIRNYARLLDTDPSPWLNLMDQQAPATARALRDDPRKLAAFDDTGRGHALPGRMMWWGVAVLVVAIAGFLAWWESASWLPYARQWLPEQKAVAAVAVPSPEPVAPAAPSPLPSLAAPMPAVNPAAVPTPEAPAATSNAPARLDVPAGHKSVAMTFKADAWVEVRDGAGNTLVSQLNKSGSQQSFTGLPPLRFKVGAAKEVGLQVDGQPFDMSPHLKNDVARFVVN